MIYYQLWDKKDFEFSFLNKIKKIVKDNEKNIYFGFDYGFYDGFLVYYGSNKDCKLANNVYNELKKQNIKVKICTNIPYDFDLILLFGCINNKKQKKYLQKNEKKILEIIKNVIA